MNEDRAKPQRYRDLQNAEEYHRKVRGESLSRRLSARAELGALRRALADVNGTRVLDAPCGTGRIHGLLKEHFSEVLSLDSSSAMLAMHEQATGADSMCGDIFDLPLGDGEVDWVVCWRLFHHVQTEADRLALLRSLARVSARGVLFSAWVDVPFNRRRGSRRQTLPSADIHRLVGQGGMRVSRVNYAAWPFQPKSVWTCLKV